MTRKINNRERRVQWASAGILPPICPLTSNEPDQNAKIAERLRNSEIQPEILLKVEPGQIERLSFHFYHISIPIIHLKPLWAIKKREKSKK